MLRCTADGGRVVRNASTLWRPTSLQSTGRQRRGGRPRSHRRAALLYLKRSCGKPVYLKPFDSAARATWVVLRAGRMSVARPPCSRTLQPGSFHRSCTACRGLRASEPAQRATKREAAVLKARWLSACRARARRRPRRSAVGWPTTTPRCARRPSRRRGASWRRRARRPSCAGAWRTRCAARRPSRCPPLTLPCRRAPWHADHQVLINNVDAQGRELRVCLPGALLRQVTSTSVCVCTVAAFHGLRAPGLGHHQAAPARRRWLCCRCRHRRLAAAQSRRPQRRLLSARSRPPRRRRSARPRARPCTCRRAHFSGVSRSHIAAPSRF